MPNLGTYPSSYIPFLPSNILPLPGDNLSFDWMETISQFSQRYMKMATAIATVSRLAGTYNFNYSSLGCDVFPPLLKIYYHKSGTGWCILHDQNLDTDEKVWFQNIGLGTADLIHDSLGADKAFYMIAYL